MYPGKVADGGVLGQLITIKPGDPHSAAAPSKYYTVFLPATGTIPSSCPACASSGGGGTNSGSLYRSNIECCNQSSVVCGETATVQPIDGNMVGPTQQGVDCLIHQGSGNSGGQDTFDPTSWTITSGGAYSPAGTTITSSDSIVNVPLYSGQTLCPGNSCPSSKTVSVLGLMQLFIARETSPQGTVKAYIMNIGGCGDSASTGGGSTGSGSGNVIGGGGSIIPVRLIRTGT